MAHGVRTAIFRLSAAAGAGTLIVDRTLSTGQRWGAAVLAVGAPLADALMSGVEARKSDADLAFGRQVDEALRTALVNVVDASGLDWKEVGVNAFLVEKRRWPKHPVLRRVGRQRIASTPGPSHVEWTADKGVIGECWTTNSDVWANLTSDFGPIANLPAAEWDALPPEERWGLSHADFVQTNQHGAVVATPIQARTGAAIGVVSADAPAGSFAMLAKQEVREALGSAAITIRNLRE